MEVIHQAHGRDAEIRAQYEAELLERQRRNDVEARRLLDVERQNIAKTSQLEMQNMQAHMMHYELVASRAHHEFEEQRRAAAEEVQRVTHAATAERQKMGLQTDNEVKAQHKSMMETWEKQKGTLCDEFRFQKEKRRVGSPTKTCRDLEPTENLTLQRDSSRKESYDFGQRSASVSSGADAHHDDRGSERSDWASHTSSISGKPDSAPSITDDMEGSLLCGVGTPSTRTTRSKMRSTPIAQHYRLFWNHGGCGRPRRRSTSSVA